MDIKLFNQDMQLRSTIDLDNITNQHHKMQLMYNHSFTLPIIVLAQYWYNYRILVNKHVAREISNILGGRLYWPLLRDMELNWSVYVENNELDDVTSVLIDHGYNVIVAKLCNNVLNVSTEENDICVEI